MTVRVRAFEDRDYNAFTRIWRVCEAEPVEPSELRARDARWDSSRFEKVRVIAADEEDAALGYGEIYHEPSRFEPGRYFLRLGVDPAKRRRGIGAAIWDRLARELAARKAQVVCRWTEDHTACVDFLSRRGFREVIRSFEQVLAVANAPLPTPASEERVAREGIRVTTLAELTATRADALEAAHELYTACRVDQPTLGRVSEWPMAEWRAYYLERDDRMPDAYFIALDGERLVGNCSLVHQPREDDVLRIGITASYRHGGAVASVAR